MKHIALAGAAALGIAGPVIAADSQMIVKEAQGSVDDVAGRLVAAAEQAGAMIVARVDHTQNAASIETEMPPTVLVIFGNPKIGTPIIQSDRRAGLDLPVRVLIWQDGETTRIGYLDPSVLADRYELDEAAQASIEKMTGALKKLTEAAAAAN
ncbi:DUF302 domain-containing protein [Notoacmeibacter sp. MSK16QG-6]|uniref:DUF302 domain-containing protein n=1 Tax=Notoacmeibacter sp. MSK16QG-6 TaxID=2957982 RepID=UPI0020A078B5|nr:DUF302 domain-containing protein [Notoacmeibacter sp. MSK16QG-6]MCP1199219.1 DUF302 domain-containing protein [Notoacmeibacter sp. MSK16QG-6]